MGVASDGMVCGKGFFLGNCIGNGNGNGNCRGNGNCSGNCSGNCGCCGVLAVVVQQEKTARLHAELSMDSNPRPTPCSPLCPLSPCGNSSGSSLCPLW